MTRILVTGASGFLGRHLLPRLSSAYPSAAVVGVRRSDYDLMVLADVERMFADHHPDVVVHLAAYSGGIGANRSYPGDFYYRNTILTAHVFDAAARLGVRKLIYTMGGCSYPATATSPIGEGQMWAGYPQAESAAYSTAKKMGLVASAAYRQQHGLNSVVLVPGNAYGEFDNFKTQDAHVIPAMIRRFYEAKIASAPAVTLWGTGSPERDFVYAGDVAEAIAYFVERYDSSDPVNLSSGTRISIRELAGAVKAAVGYTGDILWDSTKPDGQRTKIFDVSRMKSLGLGCGTSLQSGLQRTVRWFESNYHTGGDGIRL